MLLDLIKSLQSHLSQRRSCYALIATTLRNKETMADFLKLAQEENLIVSVVQPEPFDVAFEHLVSREENSRIVLKHMTQLPPGFGLPKLSNRVHDLWKRRR